MWESESIARVNPEGTQRLTDKEQLAVPVKWAWAEEGFVEHDRISLILKDI